MKLYPLLGIILIGCTDLTVPVSTSSGSDSVPDAGGAPAASAGDKGPGICGQSQHEQVSITGQDVDIEVPVLCDPNYEDHGDPPPERKNDKWDPIEIPVQNYAITTW